MIPLQTTQIIFIQSIFFATGGSILQSNGHEIRMRWENSTVEELHLTQLFVPVEFAGVGAALVLFVSDE